MELELTKAEEKAMKILWSIKKGLIREVVEKYDDPKPAYTTVATIFKILEKKGFVGRKPIANSHEYYPLVERAEYTNGFMKSFIRNYFSNSFKSMVSEFSNKEELSTQEMEDLIAHFKSKIEDKNKK
ncbi:BlaI/MecI/CopY family transcriptional regulator [Fulvivirga sp. M361]|uniref:BlaI/MecI/CopY family transcriptional regulator n=1 Tax=Fulvivirga sp. M361 TaxID=2594266 RepID=UPI001179A589|nr:BlaI/MecI/CopY family transcriptional regulator [Fulvivirga sp. M361]TRX60644.1 BlaI/MecI/CopY family transcriptional regulator [Fulvivirga sp. M361]